MTKPIRFSDEFRALVEAAVHLAKTVGVEAILLLLDGPTDWDATRSRPPMARNSC